MDTLIVRIDGASRGNPGHAGIGVVITDEDGNVLREISEYIGETTNNVAEYTALIRGLHEASETGASKLRIFTDSELLARQVAGIYRVKAPHLKQLNETVCRLMSSFREASLSHVPREENSDADRLASQAAQRRKSQPQVTGRVSAPSPAAPEGQGSLDL